MTTLKEATSLLLHVFVEECGSRLSTVVSVLVLGHEASDSGHGAVLSQAGNLSVRFDSVVFEGLEWDGLVGALYLFGFGVDLFLALFSSSTEAQDQVQGGFLLDVVVAEGASVLELLSGKDETLLIGGDALLVLNLGLDIVNSVGRLNIERNGLA